MANVEFVGPFKSYAIRPNDRFISRAERYQKLGDKDRTETTKRASSLCDAFVAYACVHLVSVFIMRMFCVPSSSCVFVLFKQINVSASFKQQSIIV